MDGAPGGGSLVPGAGVVLDLGDPDDLDYLWSVDTDGVGTVVCLWREGVVPPAWFADIAHRIAAHRAVVVLRYPGVGTGFVDCRGDRHRLPGPDLSAAVRALAAGSAWDPSPGYREVAVEDLVDSGGA